MLIYCKSIKEIYICKGSGAIESSNKTVVQLRLKQAGMRWSVEGANYMIALRCMYESEYWSEIEKIVVDEIYH